MATLTGFETVGTEIFVTDLCLVSYLKQDTYGLDAFFVEIWKGHKRARKSLKFVTFCHAIFASFVIRTGSHPARIRSRKNGRRGAAFHARKGSAPCRP